MKEEDWLEALSSGVPREVLPALHDWYLEQERKGPARLCGWFLDRIRAGGFRQQYSKEGTPKPPDHVGPWTVGREVWWHYGENPGVRWSNDIPRAFRVGILSNNIFLDADSVREAWGLIFRLAEEVWGEQ